MKLHPSILYISLTITLVLGFLLKFPCTQSTWGGFEYQTGCYSDIIALFSARNLDQGLFPYLESDFEYPAGIGLIVGLSARFVTGLIPFFTLQSLLLALAAGTILLVLLRVRGARPELLAFAAAPSLVLYSFHNWDLLAVATLMIGLLMFLRRSDTWAGIWLGVGASIKLFPGLVIPGLFLIRWQQERRPDWRLLLGAMSSFAAINLPIALANPAGWWYPWNFQSTRFPNFETHWFFLYRHFGSSDPTSFWWTTYPTLTGGLSGLLFLILFGLVLWFEYRGGRKRPLVMTAAVVLLFLLTAKVFSPQYILWLLPFLALLRLPWQAFLLVPVADFFDWWAVSHYFLALGTPGAETALTLLEIAVFARYLVLGWLLWVILKVPEPSFAHSKSQG